MSKRTENSLISLGFNTELITKIKKQGFNLSVLKSMGRKTLASYQFSTDEVEIIISKIQRKQPSQEITASILSKSGKVCCFCADGNTERHFQIHHIEEYHLTQNNDENNLLLVCPNHHVNIHREKLSSEDQLIVKKNWESVWSIAMEYKNKGIEFPFGAFIPVDYSFKGPITDIFNFKEPSGAVCCELANSSLAHNSIEILNRDHQLIIVGDSGSGKTTLAKGIAGHFKDFEIFMSVISDKSSIEIAREVAQFLTLSNNNIILIIDDANTVLKPQQLEQILKLVSYRQKIIIVNTRETFVDNSSIEFHFPNSLQYVSWPLLNEYVKENILAYEQQIVNFLEVNNADDFMGTKIGLGHLDCPLKIVSDNYANTTESVWQFIYMLGGGFSRNTSNYAELHAKERFDLVVLYISIKQIANFEQGTSLDEIIELSSRNNNLKTFHFFEKDWLELQLEQLCKKRILTNVRGKYKTVHREFARAFIELSFKSQKQNCEELLNEIFSDFSRAKEIMILWSWLRYTEVKTYINQWFDSLKILDWKNLADSCMHKDLHTVCILAIHLHEYDLSGRKKIAKEVFRDKADVIASLINRASQGTLYFFYKIMTTLKHHCEEIIVPLLDQLNLERVAFMIKNSETDSFQSLQFLFNTIEDMHINWIKNLRNEFKFNDFKSITSRSKKGNIDALCSTIQFYRSNISNIKRSQFKIFIDHMCNQIRDCNIEEINFSSFPHSIALFELNYLPSETDRISESLNLKKLISSYENTVPRHWGNLLLFCNLFQYSINNNFAQHFVDGLNSEKIVKNISRYYLDNRYEFRLILIQLAYGSTNTKRNYARKLQPFVENIMYKFPNDDDHNDILLAFNHLDKKLGSETCLKLKKPIPNRNFKKTNSAKQTYEFKELEDSNEDYDMLTFLIGSTEN
ncbi:nSTAND3 domain-containing NTPase [Elizabethkingia meningoseptica]